MITINVKNDKEKIEAFTLCLTYKKLDNKIKLFTVENNKRFIAYFDYATQLFYDNELTKKEHLIKQAKRHDPHILIIDNY